MLVIPLAIEIAVRFPNTVTVTQVRSQVGIPAISLSYSVLSGTILLYAPEPCSRRTWGHGAGNQRKYRPNRGTQQRRSGINCVMLLFQRRCVLAKPRLQLDNTHQLSHSPINFHVHQILFDMPRYIHLANAQMAGWGTFSAVWNGLTRVWEQKEDRTVSEKESSCNDSQKPMNVSLSRK